MTLLREILRYARGWLRTLFRSSRISVRGFQFDFSDAQISDSVKRFIRYETYEQDELDILQVTIDEEDAILELGAGIGFISSFACFINPNISYYAVEANPQLIPQLRLNHKLNNIKIPIVNCVLNHGGSDMIKFYLEENFWSSSTIRRSDDAREVLIKCEDLNEFIIRSGINFLICDIEGGESDIIAKLDFTPISKILIEVHPHVIGEKQVSELIKHILNQSFYLDTSRSKNNCLFFSRY